MGKEIITIGLSPDIYDYLNIGFTAEHRPAIMCRNLTEARRHMGSEAFSLIVYDAAALSLQETKEAVDSLRRLSQAPMLVLAPDEAVERVLEAGADCCLPPEMGRDRAAAYARALIRRYTLYNHHDIAEPDASALYRGELMIDPLHHRVTLAGEEISLQRREFRLLLYFARNPGIVLTADNISAEVWMSEDNYTHNVTVAVAELRRKLKDDKSNPTYIETVHGVGYRFLPDKD